MRLARPKASELRKIRPYLHFWGDLRRLHIVEGGSILSDRNVGDRNKSPTFGRQEQSPSIGSTCRNLMNTHFLVKINFKFTSFGSFEFVYVKDNSSCLWRQRNLFWGVVKFKLHCTKWAIFQTVWIFDEGCISMKCGVLVGIGLDYFHLFIFENL